MTAISLNQTTLKLVPENQEEAQMLDSWSHRSPRVINSQRTFDQVLTSIILEFTNE